LIYFNLLLLSSKNVIFDNISLSSWLLHSLFDMIILVLLHFAIQINITSLSPKLDIVVDIIFRFIFAAMCFLLLKIKYA